MKAFPLFFVAGRKVAEPDIAHGARVACLFFGLRHAHMVLSALRDEFLFGRNSVQAVRLCLQRDAQLFLVVVIAGLVLELKPLALCVNLSAYICWAIIHYKDLRRARLCHRHQFLNKCCQGSCSMLACPSKCCHVAFICFYFSECKWCRRQAACRATTGGRIDQWLSIAILDSLASNCCHRMVVFGSEPASRYPA